MSDVQFARWGRRGVAAWLAASIAGSLLVHAQVIVHIFAIAALAAVGVWAFWFMTGALRWFEEREKGAAR